jgi:hypothetical protein
MSRTTRGSQKLHGTDWRAKTLMPPIRRQSRLEPAMPVNLTDTPRTPKSTGARAAMTSEYSLFYLDFIMKHFCRLTIFNLIGMATCLLNFKGRVFKIQSYLEMLTIDDDALDMRLKGEKRGACRIFFYCARGCKRCAWIG